MPPDHISLSITPLSLWLGNRRLARGTGFFVGHTSGDGAKFLSVVTNFHVLAGFGPGWGRTPLGDRVELEVRQAGRDPNKVLKVVYPLETSKGERTWLTPASHPEADVAVLPLPLGSVAFEVPPYCLGMNWVDYDIVPYPGEPVSVVGYPLGWRDKVNRLPLWKTGHIASEPEEDFDGQPRFLIDITGRQGMSGSPVIAGHKDLYFSKSGMPMQRGSGALLGVYASNAMRFDDREPAVDSSITGEDSAGSALGDRPELGFVWKASILREVFSSLDIEDFARRIFSKLPSL
jgi:Trypsin-like peptidase domain